MVTAADSPVWLGRIDILLLALPHFIPQKSFFPASPAGPVLCFILPKICSNTTIPMYRRERIKTVLGETFKPDDSS
jgi:hypothetical protein